MADRDREEKAREYADQAIRRRTPPFGENAHKDIMEDFHAGHRSRDAEVRELVEGLRAAVAVIEEGTDHRLRLPDEREFLESARALLSRYKEDGDAA